VGGADLLQELSWIRSAVRRGIIVGNKSWPREPVCIARNGETAPSVLLDEPLSSPAPKPPLENVSVFFTQGGGGPKQAEPARCGGRHPLKESGARKRRWVRDVIAFTRFCGAGGPIQNQRGRCRGGPGRQAPGRWW
jgi:hypothetical protein